MSENPPRQSYHRLPGNRYVRVPRGKTERVLVGTKRAALRPPPSPQLILAGGFAALILVGWLLLLLPWATAPGQTTTPIDALFTAASAVCVTGLVVLDTGTHWSPFGQAVIMVLIQLGGLGFMTVSTFLFLVVGHRVTLQERMLLREALGGATVGGAARLGLQILVLTLIIEIIGAALFFLYFLRLTSPDTALWWSVFHSISAFNNAGFDVFGGFRSIVPFHDEPFVPLVTAVLIILGGISFTVMIDLWRVRSFNRLTLDSKLVLVTTAGLLLVGTLLFQLIEGGSGAVRLGPLDAFFMSTTARTAGFNAVDLALLKQQSLVLIIALMFIGAASGSTGGGIKVNTFSLLFLSVLSAIRGRTRPEAFGRLLPYEQVFRALTVALLALALVFVVTLVLTTTEAAPFLALLFETVSAFGTVGLSVGITPTLSDAGRLAIIFLMYGGRIGPLTLVLALTIRERRVRYRYPSEEIKIG